MKGTISWVLLTLWILAAGGAHAGDYRSGFGFEISVPDVWVVLTHDEVGEDVDDFLESDGTDAFGMLPIETREAVIDGVQGGALEMFYRRDEKSAQFLESVNIVRQDSPLPGSTEEVSTICGILPGEFSRVFGRPIALEACEMREVLGQRALYLQFDGAVQGTKTVQYQLEQSADRTLVLTAIAAEGNLPRMLGEFESMVASIRLDY